MGGGAEAREAGRAAELMLAGLRLLFFVVRDWVWACGS